MGALCLLEFCVNPVLTSFLVKIKVQSARSKLVLRSYSALIMLRLSALRTFIGRVRPAVACVNSVGLHWTTPPKSIVLRTMAAGIERVSLDNSNKFVSIEWKNDEDERSYPFVWLRDNCRCDTCYHESANQRRILMGDLDLDMRPKEVARNGDGKGLSVVWQDGHQSAFSAEWLREHCFTKGDQDVAKNEPRLWGRDLQGNVPVYDFERVLSNDQALYEWLETLHTTGITLLTGVRKELGEVERIGNRVGHLKKTNYGYTFRVESKFDPSNLAYTSQKLGLHVDLPQYSYIPGVQLLHCLQQAEGSGGDNQFADGFKVAEQLKEEQHDVYEVLCNTLIDFRDLGKEDELGHFNLRNKAPTISLDRHAKVYQIFYNNGIRDALLGVDADQVYEVYRALKIFDDLLHHPSNLINLRMDSGQMVAFNNRRVLHGRSAYDVGVSGKRSLQGGYLDWDEIWSKMRVLQKLSKVTAAYASGK